VHIVVLLGKYNDDDVDEMSHLPWSVCLCEDVKHTGEPGKNQSRIRLGETHLDQRNHKLYGGAHWRSLIRTLGGQQRIGN